MRLIARTAALINLALFGCSPAAGAKQNSIPHPDKSSARIEFFVESPAGSGPWPTVIFLHGHQRPANRIGGQAYVTWGVLDRFANEGYLAVSISLPGYGRSDGPEDFAGPFTQRAVQSVIAKLEAEQQAIPDKILIEGVSLGAVTGALVAAKDHDIAGLVLISGLYDLPQFFAKPKSPGALALKTAVIRQTGGGEVALRSRSALALAPHIRASTLILNGAKDDRTDPAQAELFAAKIRAHGGTATALIFSDYGHQIPVDVRDAKVHAFITETLNR